MSTAWYRQGVDEVLAALASDRLKAYPRPKLLAAEPSTGWNELVFRRTPAWVRFLRQFNDAMVIILLLTAAITGLSRPWAATCCPTPS